MMMGHFMEECMERRDELIEDDLDSVVEAFWDDIIEVFESKGYKVIYDD